jgi:1-acyl-sn-glycerol-3-phosphate acyltransferase
VSGPDSLSTLGRTALAIALLVPGLLLASVLALLGALRGASSRQVNSVYRGFTRSALFVGGTRLEVNGLDHIDPTQAYIVVPNHESNWDPVALAAGLEGLVIRFIAKRQLMAIPIFGPALRATGNVEVRRDRSATDIQSVKASFSARDPVVSVLFYAEGRRSRDGALHEFRKGAFATAITSGLPILPVASAGCRRIWLPETVRLRKGKVVVEIGAPIPVEGLAYEQRDALRKQAFEEVVRLRNRARARLRALGEEPGGID